MNYILRKNSMTPSALTDVMTQTNLSSGAKVLYTYLFGLRSGDIINNERLIKDNVAVSRAMVNNYKRELKVLKLIHENKDGETNIRFIYVGSLRMNALVYATDWKRVDILEEDN
jgi:hypothetical protein